LAGLGAKPLLHLDLVDQLAFRHTGTNLSALFDQLRAALQQIVEHFVFQRQQDVSLLPPISRTPPLAQSDLRTVPREMLRSFICLVFMTPLQVTERILFAQNLNHADDLTRSRSCVVPVAAVS